MENQKFSILVQDHKAEQAAFMAKVYMWMSFALIITGLTAFVVVSSPALINMIIMNKIMFYGILIGELALVFFISSRIQNMTTSLASALFLFYSFLNGLTLSILLFIYTGSSVANAFFITAGTFAVMSIYGYTTKKDLTSIGNLCFMALIGIIIASIVNIFFIQNGMMSLIISYVAVLVFVGLTAYDTQKIKNMVGNGAEISEDDKKRGAIMGALALYLDFINLFIYILRIVGNRR